MSLVSHREVEMDLGTVVEMEARSRRGRYRRKKWMGMCKGWGQKLISVINRREKC